MFLPSGLVVSTIVMLGCHRGGPLAGDRLVGTWSQKVSLQVGQQDMREDGTISFRDDGTWKAHTRVSLNGKANTLIDDAFGTWKPSGKNRYTELVTDFNWTTEGVSAAGAKKIHDRFLADKQKLLAADNKDPIMAVTWIGSNTFTTEQGGKTHMYRRED